jgi:hypothetical protein
VKKPLCLALTFAFVLLWPILAPAADTQVRGHWRDSDRDGVKDTYVDSYRRTTPNDTSRDNYSHPGNFNPNRGEITSGNPFAPERERRPGY